MERYNLGVHRGKRPAFDQLPAKDRRRVFGLDYAWVRGMQGGEMFFTRQGWSIAEALLPEFWFDEERYRRIGRPLPGATGAVYRMPVAHPRRPEFSLVVKFSRFAQDVGVTVAGPEATFGWPAHLFDNAEFADPFSEFSRVQQLRQRSRGRLRIKSPLLIYCPAAHSPAWQLGRDACRMSLLESALLRDQTQNACFPMVALEKERVYVLVYHWVNGVDVDQAYRMGAFDRAEMSELTRRVAACLTEIGFAVVDHKPKHIILRCSRSGTWLRRHGEWVWALIDYELLVPLPASQDRNPT